MKKRPLLTICIPTYNRYNKLKSMVERLLACPRADFEVLIQDNCSTDGTQHIKEDIKDARLQLMKNPVNIGGIINGYGALYSATGKYCMLCLDKDTVMGDKISVFLDYLIANPSIKYGLCELNINIDNDPVIYSSLVECFNFFAYHSRHPSGMFWNSEIFHNTQIVPKILSSHTVFGFFSELIFAECASTSCDGCYYRKRLIVTETPAESAKKKTLTYNTSQIFFFPKNRIREFSIYLGQLQCLRLDHKFKLWFKVFSRGLIVTSLGFRSAMRDEEHLQHYGINTRNVSRLELIGISFRYCFTILFTSRRKVFNNLFKNNF